MTTQDTTTVAGKDRLESVLAAISTADRTGLLLRDAQNAVSMMEANGVPRDEIADSISRSFLSIPQPPDEAYLKQATELAKALPALRDYAAQMREISNRQDAVKRALGMQAAQERADAEYADRMKKVANRQQIRGDDVPVEAEPPATDTTSRFALGRQPVDGERAVRRRTTAERVDAMQSADFENQYVQSVSDLMNEIEKRKEKAQAEKERFDRAKEDRARKRLEERRLVMPEEDIVGSLPPMLQKLEDIEVEPFSMSQKLEDIEFEPSIPMLQKLEDIEVETDPIVMPEEVIGGRDERLSPEARAERAASRQRKRWLQRAYQAYLAEKDPTAPAAGYGEAAEKRAAVTESDRFKAEERLAKAEEANEINPGKNEEKELEAARRNYNHVFGKRIEGVGGRFGRAKPPKDFVGEVGDAPEDLKEAEAELANIEGSKFYEAAVEARSMAGGSLTPRQQATLAKANALRNKLSQREREREAYRLQEAPFQETSPELEEIISPAPVPEPVPEPIPEDVPDQTQTKPALVSSSVPASRKSAVSSAYTKATSGLQGTGQTKDGTVLPDFFARN